MWLKASVVFPCFIIWLRENSIFSEAKECRKKGMRTYSRIHCVRQRIWLLAVVRTCVVGSKISTCIDTHLHSTLGDGYRLIYDDHTSRAMHRISELFRWTHAHAFQIHCLPFPKNGQFLFCHNANLPSFQHYPKSSQLRRGSYFYALRLRLWSI